MFINYNDLTEKLKDTSEVCILVSKEYSYMVEDVYDRLIEIYPDISIFIISSDDVLCPLKHKKMDFTIILGVECPEHPFERSVFLQDELDEIELMKLKNCENVVFDSTFSEYKKQSSKLGFTNLEQEKIEGDALIVTKNAAVLRYYSRKFSSKSFYNLNIENRMEYLTRRINLSEISKNNKTFAIIFVHEVYKDLAIKIKDALDRSSRSAYLLFLKNVRYSRLITIEKIDTLVLIDCPSFDNFNIDVTLPILSPADVQYILTRKWDPDYFINKFDVLLENTEDKEMCKYEGAGKLILESEFFGFEYSKPEEEDLEIHEGRKGIAGEYEHE